MGDMHFDGRMTWVLLICAACSSTTGTADRPTFKNPLSATSADPWVIRHEGRYLYTYTTGHDVTICAAEKLQHIAANCRVVWTPPEGTAYSSQIWAPELHYIDANWFVYVAASDGENENHRMIVLSGESQDPQGSYTFRGKIAASTDRWAIDGTVLQHGGTSYFVWSGWEGFEDGRQDLYIAQMSDPLTISGDRVCIATPTHAWEMHGLPINEAPQVLRDTDALFITYSGSGFWTPEYSVGLLTFTGGDVMDPSSWAKSPEPVFSGSGTSVEGVGHASFTSSCDGTENWIVYHAHRPSDAPQRDLRMQPFTFRDDGMPDFGRPVEPGVPLEVPSGC